MAKRPHIDNFHPVTDPKKKAKVQEQLKRDREQLAAQRIHSSHSIIETKKQKLNEDIKNQLRRERRKKIKADLLLKLDFLVAHTLGDTIWEDIRYKVEKGIDLTGRQFQAVNNSYKYKYRIFRSLDIHNELKQALRRNEE